MVRFIKKQTWIFLTIITGFILVVLSFVNFFTLLLVNILTKITEKLEE